MKLILGIDTETTGISADDRPVQIAAVLLHPVTWEIEDRFCTLVNPERPIQLEAQKVHGITQEQVEGQPTLDDVWSTTPLAKWVADSDYLFGHNVGFDIGMLGTKPLIHLKVIDTLRLARVMYPKMPNHKLQTVVRVLDLPKREAHDALADIESCADFLHHINVHHGWDVLKMHHESANLKSNTRRRLGL